MQIIRATLNPAGQFGPELVLDVDGLTEEPEQRVLIPLAALPDRRKLYGIPTCAECRDPDCIDATCPCCTEALEMILAEHYCRLNPDKLANVRADAAEKIIRIGGVSGKRWNAERRAIEDVPSPQALPVALKATGKSLSRGNGTWTQG